MNLLDENFPEDQAPLLRSWGIAYRRIGVHVARSGVKDDNVIPLLHRLRQVTLFTQDRGFFQRALCHPAYCIAWLDVRTDDTAQYVRRFLAHPRFGTKALCLGVVARVHHDAVHFWQRRCQGLQRVAWVSR